MLLALLLLLLIPLLLLFCTCGGAAAAGAFKAIPTDQTQQLITYHTEGQGEDKDIPLLQIPTEVKAGQLGAVESNRQWIGGWDGGSGGEWGAEREERNEWHYFHDEFGGHSGFTGGHSGLTGGHSGLTGLWAYEGLALSEFFLGDYYSKKSKFMAEKQASSDTMLIYDYENEDVSTGSLDDICCELNEGDDLAFLNDLGPHFKTLAELCLGSAIDSEVSSVRRPTTPNLVIDGAHQNIKGQAAHQNIKGQAAHQTIKGQSSMGALHTKVGGSTSASASVSASASSSTTQISATDFLQSSSTSSAGQVLTNKVPNQTLLIQQPTMYYATTPVYVMDPQPQATLLVASAPVLGMQENVVLVGQKGGNLVQGTSTLGGLKQTHTKVLVENKPAREAAIFEASGPQMLLGQSNISTGSVRIVEKGRVQTMEPVHTTQSSLHSSFSGGQSIQLSPGLTGSQNGLIGSQHSLSFLTVPHGGMHQNVREERISVIEKSFQSSSAM